MFGKQKPEMAKTETPKSKLEEIAAAAEGLIARRDTVRMALAKAKQAAADAALSGAEINVREIVRLDAEGVAITSAFDGIWARRPAAILADNIAEAERLQIECAPLREELAGLESRTKALLEQLGQEEGVAYSMHILACQQDADSRAYLVPKSLTLRAKINKLEERAYALNEAAVQNTGSVEVDDVDDFAVVISAILRTRTNIPSYQALLEWLERAQTSKGSIDPRGKRARYLVRWDSVGHDGVIEVDYGSSSIYVPEFATKSASGYDTLRGTFKGARSEARL